MRESAVWAVVYLTVGYETPFALQRPLALTFLGAGAFAWAGALPPLGATAAWIGLGSGFFEGDGRG
jgi:hypothetical protein